MSYQVKKGAKMTQLDPTDTVKLHHLRSGRLETWSAQSADGQWTYLREEDTGTPWVVTHVPTGRWTLYPSLPSARKATANGLLEWLQDEADEEEMTDATGDEV